MHSSAKAIRRVCQNQIHALIRQLREHFFAIGFDDLPDKGFYSYHVTTAVKVAAANQ